MSLKFDAFEQGFIDAMGRDQGTTLDAGDLAHDAVARISLDCQRIRQAFPQFRTAEDGARFYRMRRGGHFSGYPPLSAVPDDAGLMHLVDAEERSAA
jgi:hypothetical protein